MLEMPGSHGIRLPRSQPPGFGRIVVVVPYTTSTFRMAIRPVPRCAVAGVELALVTSRSEMIDAQAP